jgi:hypothetical protein
MWIELDYEDLIALNPDSIILIMPKQMLESDRFGAPKEPSSEEVARVFGSIAQLPISAVENGRLGIIDHPLGLLPSGVLADVAQEMGSLMKQWSQ